MDSLLMRVVRLARTNPAARRALLPVLAREFPNQKALERYLQEHPHADKSRHHVESEKPKPKPSGEDKKVEVKIDEKALRKRAPKVQSPDLKKYPPKIDPDDLKPEHREEIKEYKLDVVGKDARQAIEIARKIREGIAKSADVCKLAPPVCAGNMGLTRDKMPQIEGGKTVRQMLDSDNALDRKKGEAMVQAGADPDSDKTILEQLVAHLGKNGVATSQTTVPVGTLRATQSEIQAQKVYGMADAHLKGKFKDIDDSVIISRDGYLLDGHHRWAALLTIDPARPMRVKVIDMNMKDLLSEAQAVPGVYQANFDGHPLDEDKQKEYKQKAKSRWSKKKKGSLREATIQLARENTMLRPHLLSALR